MIQWIDAISKIGPIVVIVVCTISSVAVAFYQIRECRKRLLRHESTTEDRITNLERDMRSEFSLMVDRFNRKLYDSDGRSIYVHRDTCREHRNELREGQDRIMSALLRLEQKFDQLMLAVAAGSSENND